MELRLAGVQEPQREFRFHSIRKFRLDFAWPDQKVACEVHGGIWTRGRHVRGGGFSTDCEKTSLAAALGWRIVNVTGEHIRSGQAQLWIRQALAGVLDAPGSEAENGR